MNRAVPGYAARVSEAPRAKDAARSTGRVGAKTKAVPRTKSTGPAKGTTPAKGAAAKGGAAAPGGAPGRARGSAPRARGVRLEGDERRAQLLALGLESFSGRAYDEVSIDDIAQRAGISKGLLYHYFPTKRDFYAATVREAARQLLDKTRTDERLGPMDKLAAGLDAYIAFVEHHGRAYTALIRGGIGTDAEVASVLEGARREILNRILQDSPAELQEDGRFRLALRGWIGFVEAAIIEWAEQPVMDRASLRTLLEHVFARTVEAVMFGAPG
jgi:AcrR family transcriptional regulator